MQDDKIEQNRTLLKNRIGATLKTLRVKRNQSLTLFGYEFSIPVSSLSYIERGVQDPSVTTLWKIVEAQNLKMSAFFKIVEAELPPDFSLIEK